MRNRKTYLPIAGVGLLVTALAVAQGSRDTPTGDAEPTAAAEARGVEMSQTSSVVQRGVKRGSQLNLEKTLDLIASPRAGGGGGGARSAAGIGGGSGRPVGGGSGDGDARNRMRGNIQEMINSGS